MFIRSPSAQFFETTAPGFFSTGSLSPVREDSSHLSIAPSKRRRSAGTISPASKTTISPMTKSLQLTFVITPPRKTFACDSVIFFKLSSAFSAFCSWQNPITALRMTINKMIDPSTYSPKQSETIPATNKIKIIISANCFKNLRTGLVFFA